MLFCAGLHEGSCPTGVSERRQNIAYTCPTLTDEEAGTLSTNSPFVLSKGSMLQHSRPLEHTNARRRS